MPSCTRRAALVASRGWSIGISYHDHVATEARPRDGRRSDPDRIPHENDGRPTGSWLLEDDEELGEPGGNPQLRAEVGVLVGQHEFASPAQPFVETVSYTHLRAHETVLDLVCRLLLEKK